ncbi:MAG: endonuclease [Flavobacteriaceae bacterium]|nr:endonuclease [Flavobacteriaceae bacterium]
MQKLLLLLVFPLLSFSQIPQYYSGIDFNQTGDALKTQLTTLITNTHTTEIYYTSSAPDVWDALRLTDLDPDDATNTNVLLMYGYDDVDSITKNDRVRDEADSCHQSGCTGLWNREHVYPKSLANPSLTTNNPGAGTDAHNLRACDGQMNSSRNNRPYEDGSGDSTITPTVGNWYPGDEWRGDVARMIMYMYVRYPSQCLATVVGVGNTTYSVDMPNVFLEWNEEDPVSSYEISRNDILEGIQGNRNPFIDNPYLASVIWNGPVAADNWSVLVNEEFATLDKIVVYPTVTSDFVYISDSTHNSYKYRVSNNLGQLLSKGETTNKIDLSKFSKGLYFVCLQYHTTQKTIKVILK